MVAEGDHDAVQGVIRELVAHGTLLRQQPVDDPWGRTYDWARQRGRLSEPVVRALCVLALRRLGAGERRQERHLTRQDVLDAFERGLLSEADVLAPLVPTPPSPAPVAHAEGVSDDVAHAEGGRDDGAAGEAGRPSRLPELPPPLPLPSVRSVPAEAVRRRPPVDLGVLRGLSCAVNGRDISMARMTLRLWEQAGRQQKAALLGQYAAWAQWALVADLVRRRGAGPDEPWARYITEQEAAYLVYRVETAQPNISAMLDAGVQVLEDDNPLFRYAPGAPHQTEQDEPSHDQ